MAMKSHSNHGEKPVVLVTSLSLRIYLANPSDDYSEQEKQLLVFQKKLCPLLTPMEKAFDCIHSTSIYPDLSPLKQEIGGTDDAVLIHRLSVAGIDLDTFLAFCNILRGYSTILANYPEIRCSFDHDTGNL